MHPILISDFDTGLGGGTSGESAGELWFPQGFWLGERKDLRLPTPTEARKYTLGSSTPRQGHSRQGDIHFHRDPVAGGSIGWACTQSGANPGTAVHTPFGEIMNNNLLVKEVSIGTIMLDANECAYRRIRFIGTLTGNVTIIVPTPANFHQGNPSATNSFDKIFQNQTTGAFAFTLKATDKDGGIALAQEKTQHMWSDGTNLFAVAGPA